MATKSTDIAKRDEMGMTTSRPDFLKEGARGTEHIRREDLQMPRLGLAQSTSWQLDSAKPEYIEDLKLGQFYNDLTRKVYGPGPLEFTVVRADPPRWIEFYPRSEGGGVKDMNVPPNDPRTQFERDDSGTSIPPKATKFYDFIIALLPSRELIALSFKMTGLKAATQLNGLLKMRNADSFAGKYTLTAGQKTNAKGTFKVHVIKNSETVDEATSEPGWVSKDVYAWAEQVHEGLKDKNIIIDRAHVEGEGEGGDASFDPGNM